MVFRYGGDEFIVLLPKTTVEDADAVRKRIKENLELYNKQSNLPFSLTIGCEKASGETVEDALSSADSDMYLNKQLKKEESITELPDHISDEVNNGYGKIQQ